MILHKDLKDLAEVRSQTWWLLGRLFVERPEPGFLEELRAALSPPGSDPEEPDRDVGLLRECLGAADAEQLSSRLTPEYTRLFRGIAVHYGPPPPYESVYRGEPLMGDATMDVRRHYEAAGFNKIAPEVGPQDHIGAELRHMSLLCYREAEAWGDGDVEAAHLRIAQQRAFLDSHLLIWLPHYAALIVKESREPFYAAVARLSARFASAARSDLDALDTELDAA